MAKYLNKNIEIVISDLSNINDLKNKYSRKQPITFICPKCSKQEHKLFGILWKRTTLLCHDCLISDMAKYYSQKEPLKADKIKTIIKPIASTQNIIFQCSKCNKIHIVQFRHFTETICESCKRSNASKNIWKRPGYHEYHEHCVIKKTGYKCIFQNRSLMNKAWEKKYGKGITGAMQIPVFQQKQHETMIKNYGGYSLESPIIRAKIDQTIEKIYGTKNIRNSQYYLDLFDEFKDRLYKNLKRLYFYDGKYFDSSWELAFYIWLKDNNIIFEYHPIPGIKYFSMNKEHTYYPDFLIDGKYYIEIKGDQFFDKNGSYIMKSQFDIDKWNCVINNAIIYRKNDILIYLKYVKEKYGTQYLQKFKQF